VRNFNVNISLYYRPTRINTVIIISINSRQNVDGKLVASAVQQHRQTVNEFQQILCHEELKNVVTIHFSMIQDATEIQASFCFW